MSLEVFSFLFWLGVCLLAMHVVAVFTETVLHSARAFALFGKSRLAGAVEGVRHASTALAESAWTVLREHPRASGLTLLYLGAAIYGRIASPAAVFGSAMAVWAWMALIVPATLTQVSSAFGALARKRRIRR
jgi:hypothetical protein